VANATAGVGKETRPARELPPRPFVPDQFDSATQMLRGLTLDYDGEDVSVDPFRTDRRK
jgi:hypothetical protein